MATRYLALVLLPASALLTPFWPVLSGQISSRMTYFHITAGLICVVARPGVKQCWWSLTGVSRTAKTSGQSRLVAPGQARSGTDRGEPRLLSAACDYFRQPASGDDGWKFPTKVERNVSRSLRIWIGIPRSSFKKIFHSLGVFSFDSERLSTVENTVSLKERERNL